MKAPELNPTAEKIDKLINRINSGDIKIPAFQRAYVWKQNQILDLLDSIIKNYPIGSILLWSTNEKLNSTRNIAGYKIPESAPEYPVNYVLDGQQRISSIYAVFSGQTEQDVTSSQYNPDLNLFEIFYDFKAKKFIAKSESIDSNCTILLRNFLDGAKLIDALNLLDKEYHEDAKELYSKFINYELPVVTIKNRAKDEVGTIFERINHTGTKLNTIDLMTAWTWTDDFHLLKQINELQEELSDKGFGEISHNILLQAISGVIQNDTTTKAILNLSGEKVRNTWEEFSESLRKAIDFLHTDFNCQTIDFLPHQQQLVSLSKFFSIAKSPSATSLDLLKKWFWKISFSDRYSTGQTTDKMNTDISNMIQFVNGNASVLDGVKYTVTEQELINTKFSKGNPITRAFLLLLAKNNPLDLLKNTHIDVETALSTYNRKQYHHVFPNSFLKTQGISQQRIFSIVNFCFLPADSNKKISKKSPADYFNNLIPKAALVDILNSNLLPLDFDLYNENNYQEFLNKRSVLIIKRLDNLSSL